MCPEDALQAVLCVCFWKKIKMKMHQLPCLVTHLFSKIQLKLLTFLIKMLFTERSKEMHLPLIKKKRSNWENVIPWIRRERNQRMMVVFLMSEDLWKIQKFPFAVHDDLIKVTLFPFLTLGTQNYRIVLLKLCLYWLRLKHTLSLYTKHFTAEAKR